MSAPISPIELQLQSIVARKLKIDPALVPLDKSILEELGLDSMDTLEVAMTIERDFAPVTISDKSAGELTTLRQVAVYIERELARSAGASEPAPLASTPPRDRSEP
jgi:acyl carrier protein